MYCLLLFCVVGKRYLPPEAKYFEQCSTSADCPKDSTCVETNGGVYYCACNNGFINDYDRLTITYPGGHCTGNVLPSSHCLVN